MFYLASSNTIPLLQVGFSLAKASAMRLCSRKNKV